LKVYIGQEQFSLEDWTYRELLPLEASIPKEKAPQTRSVGRNDDHIQFTALEVNEAEIIKIWPYLETNEYIPMSDVARMAYEKHRTQNDFHSEIAAFHEGAGSDNSDLLSALALAIATASEVDLFGKHDPSTVFEKIPSGVENYFEFRDKGNSLHPMGNDNPQYIDVSIKQSDLDAAIKSINEYEFENINTRMSLIELCEEASKQGWNFTSKHSLHILDLADGLRQAGLDGAVRMWGKTIHDFDELTRNEVLKEIPKKHWDEFSIDGTSCIRLNNVGEPIDLDSNFNTYSHNFNKKGYVDIYLNREQALQWLRTDAKQYKGRR